MTVVHRSFCKNYSPEYLLLPLQKHLVELILSINSSLIFQKKGRETTIDQNYEKNQKNQVQDSSN